jgi:hypothetical protein
VSRDNRPRLLIAKDHCICGNHDETFIRKYHSGETVEYAGGWQAAMYSRTRQHRCCCSGAVHRSYERAVAERCADTKSGMTETICLRALRRPAGGRRFLTLDVDQDSIIFATVVLKSRRLQFAISQADK